MNRETALPRLLRAAFGWHGFAALLALYILIHYALRVALSPTIAVDDVAETIFAQNPQWSYYHRQPPLYPWLLWGTFRLFGVNIAALLLLKYVLITLGYVFFYLSVPHQPKLDRMGRLKKGRQGAHSERVRGRSSRPCRADSAAAECADVIDTDLIYVMDGGRICESGTHAELLAHGGVYARVYTLQLAEEKADAKEQVLRAEAAAS